MSGWCCTKSVEICQPSAREREEALKDPEFLKGSRTRQGSGDSANGSFTNQSVKPSVPKMPSLGNIGAAGGDSAAGRTLRHRTVPGRNDSKAALDHTNGITHAVAPRPQGVRLCLRTITSQNELIKFRRQVISDFLRRSRFDPFMGESSTSVIVRLADLEADGKQINIPLVNQLTGDGVGAGTLRGNEEQLDSYGFPIWADWGRNAVANNRAANKESSFNVRSTARDLLRGWGRRIVRDDLVDALLSIPTGAVQAGRLRRPATASTASSGRPPPSRTRTRGCGQLRPRPVRQRWSATTPPATFASGLGNIDAVGDKMSAASVRLRSQLAKQSGVDPANPGVYNGRPKITPWEIEDAGRGDVCLLPRRPRVCKSLQADP
jgi:hypothetical protein